jgi:hypothetical protein
MNINNSPIQVLKKDEQTSEQILYRNDDDDSEENELKKIEKKAKGRKLKLDRSALQAARELEEATRNRLKLEERIAQLERELAAKEDNRRSNKIQAQSSKKNSSRQEDEEEELEGDFIANKASSKDSERPVTVQGAPTGGRFRDIGRSSTYTAPARRDSSARKRRRNTDNNNFKFKESDEKFYEDDEVPSTTAGMSMY